MKNIEMTVMYQLINDRSENENEGNNQWLRKRKRRYGVSTHFCRKTMARQRLRRRGSRIDIGAAASAYVRGDAFAVAGKRRARCAHAASFILSAESTLRPKRHRRPVSGVCLASSGGIGAAARRGIRRHASTAL